MPEINGNLNHEQKAKFLVALGRTMLQGFDFEDLVEHPTKGAVSAMRTHLQQEGFDGALCEDIVRQGAQLFKRGS